MFNYQEEILFFVYSYDETENDIFDIFLNLQINYLQISVCECQLHFLIVIVKEQE